MEWLKVTCLSQTDLELNPSYKSQFAHFKMGVLILLLNCLTSNKLSIT